jgi:hypothetical protein
MIKISSQLEWEEMHRLLHLQPSFKIFVHFEPYENELNGHNKNVCPYGNNCFGCLYDPPQCTHPLFWEMNSKVVDCLWRGDVNFILLAKQYVMGMLDYYPNHCLALYHAACAEALLGNVNDGLNYLEKAIHFGYRDLDNILMDEDLNNIKQSERFLNLVQKLGKVDRPEISNNSNNIDEKIQKIIDMGFNVPRDIIKDLLVKYDGNIDIVQTMLYN